MFNLKTCFLLIIRCMSASGRQRAPGHHINISKITMAYYRQQLQRRASGPVQRELITLCAALDALIKGSASKGTDILCQRLKSIEAVMSGTHWSVAQRSEVSPQESQVLAAKEELSGAQKEAYDRSLESKFTLLRI